MVQVLSQKGNIFGQIGKGLGQGLADQVPKEIERHRLASGLKELGENKNLTPFQQYAGLASTPGITPQMIQSGGELLRQQAYLNSLKNQYEGQGTPQKNQGGYLPSQQELNEPVKGEIPTLADQESTTQSYKNFIPPTEIEERNDAYNNFQKNPARYDYDFNKALDERKAITARNQQIQKAYQNQEEIAVGKEEKLKSAFDKEATRLGIIPIGNEKTPPNFDPSLYQLFEERLLNSILPKSEGGEGLTQEQAIKKQSEDLRKSYENYRDLSTLDAWSPRDFNRRVNAIEGNMSHFGQPGKKVIMDKLIADHQVSPLYAAHKAYPIKNGEVPTLKKIGVQIGTGGFAGVSIPKVNDATYAKLKNEMGKNNSPLSIAYEMERKNQDPRGWLNYLNNHRDDLEVWQADQLTKNLNTFDLKDMWLRAWE